LKQLQGFKHLKSLKNRFLIVELLHSTGHWVAHKFINDDTQDEFQAGYQDLPIFIMKQYTCYCDIKNDEK
jgi:hypothetical protein